SSPRRSARGAPSHPWQKSWPRSCGGLLVRVEGSLLGRGHLCRSRLLGWRRRGLARLGGLPGGVLLRLALGLLLRLAPRLFLGFPPRGLLGFAAGGLLRVAELLVALADDRRDRLDDQLARADRVVVAGDDELDRVGIAVRVDEADDRDTEARGLADRDRLGLQ